MKKIIFSYYPLIVRWNHGVHLLVSICRERGIQVYILPLDNLAYFNMKIKEINPDFISFSFVCAEDYYSSIPYVEDAKKLGCQILAGGVYARKGAFIDSRLFDFICRGEGELLPDFILNGDTKIFDSPYYHKDINNLPLPDYNIKNTFIERNYPPLVGMNIIPYSSSRGCPYQCSFCEVQFQPKSIRIKTSIKEDMEYLYERFIPDLFYFTDELLPYYDMRWRAQMTGNRHKFYCYIRADISEEHLLFLINNGLYACAFGIESGDEKYRNEILNKNLYDKDIYRTVEILNKYKIHYAPFYMIDSPKETDEIKSKTMRMFQTLGGYPSIFKYVELKKKVIDLDEKIIYAYADKINVDINDLLDSFHHPDNHIESFENGFILYQILEDAIFIVDVYNVPDYENNVKKICKNYGKNKVRGYVTKHVKGYKRKYNAKECYTLLEREVG